MRSLTRIVCLFAIMVVFASPLSSDAAESPQRVSLIQLLATPERFDGHLVQVAGYFVYDEENRSLYLSPEDAENGISNGGVEVASFATDYPAANLQQKYNRKYINLTGIFHASAKSEWPNKFMNNIRVPSLTDVRNIASPPYRYCPPCN